MKRLVIGETIFVVVTFLIYGILLCWVKNYEAAIVITLGATAVGFFIGIIGILPEDKSKNSMVIYLSGLVSIVSYTFDNKLFHNTNYFLLAVIFSIFFIIIFSALFAKDLQIKKSTTVLCSLLQLAAIWCGRLVLTHLLL